MKPQNVENFCCHERNHCLSLSLMIAFFWVYFFFFCIYIQLNIRSLGLYQLVKMFVWECWTFLYVLCYRNFFLTQYLFWLTLRIEKWLANIVKYTTVDKILILLQHFLEFRIFHLFKHTEAIAPHFTYDSFWRIDFCQTMCSMICESFSWKYLTTITNAVVFLYTTRLLQKILLENFYCTRYDHAFTCKIGFRLPLSMCI